MKIYKLGIDTSKPSKQVVAVPANTSKYGLAVGVTFGNYTATDPYVQLIEGDNTVLSSTGKLDDGSFLFELSSGSVPQSREVLVHVINTALSAGEAIAGGSDGIATAYEPTADTKDNTILHHVVANMGLLWFYDGAGKTFADGDSIEFTADTVYGRYVRKTVGGRIKTEWQDVCTIPAGTWKVEDLKSLASGYIGKTIDHKIRVLLKEIKGIAADAEIEDQIDFSNVEAGNLSADTFALSGVTYVPTELSVGDVVYTVLAAVQPTPATEE